MGLLAPSDSLDIRPWQVSDASALNQVIEENRGHLQPWMPWAGQTISLKDRQLMLARWENEQSYSGDRTFGIFQNQRLIGGCGLHRPLGPADLEIGYWIHQDHLRKGYATQAATYLTNLGFASPETNCIDIHCDQANFASQGIPRKLGYSFIGQIKAPLIASAETGTQVVWRIDRQVWLSRCLNP
jgi:RimJ/RimL family protein N-acetyltransferase